MAEETPSAASAPSPPSPLLRVDGLRTRFLMRDSAVHAVNGISYDLAPGEALGIVGESGCGKSVSALSLMRLLPEPPASDRGRRRSSSTASTSSRCPGRDAHGPRQSRSR